MNKTLSVLIIFSVGFATGIVSTRAYFENEYRMRAEEEIDSVKKAFRSHISKQEKQDEKPVEQPSEYETKIVRSGYLEPEPEKPTDYRKFYEKANEEAIYEDKLEEEMAKKEAPSEVTKPYLISEEDYSETMETFDKMSCTFYIPDRLVVDDLSREVVEPDILGEDNIEYMIKTNQEFIYIRNESIGCDMEISKSHESVAETGDLVWRG